MSRRPFFRPEAIQEQALSEARAKYVPRRPAVAARHPHFLEAEKDVAELLRRVLAESGTEQLDVARDLRVSTTLVSAWCRGDQPIHHKHIMALRDKQLARAILLASLMLIENDRSHT